MFFKDQKFMTQRTSYFNFVQYSYNRNFEVQEEKSNPTFGYLARPFPFAFDETPDEPMSSSSSASSSSSLSSSSSSSSLLLARDAPCLDVSALGSFVTASFSSSVDGASAKASSSCLRDLAQASRSLSYASSLHRRVSILRQRPSCVLKRAPVAVVALICLRTSLRPGSKRYS